MEDLLVLGRQQLSHSPSLDEEQNGEKQSLLQIPDLAAGDPVSFLLTPFTGDFVLQRGHGLNCTASPVVPCH